MRRLAILGILVVGIVAMLGPVAAEAATRPIVIHEIYYNSPGRDTGSNSSLNAEWVQLHNRTGHKITLTHWTLRDAAGHVYKFGTYTIKAHGYVTIHTGKGLNTRANRYWGHSWYIWNNTGDRATLKNANGTVKSRCSYSDPNENFAAVTC